LQAKARKIEEKLLKIISENLRTKIKEVVGEKITNLMIINKILLKNLKK
jgi:hypothetical protein